MPPSDYRRPPAPRKVNKAPPKRRDVPAPPRPDIQTGTGYRAPAPRPAPKPRAPTRKPSRYVAAPKYNPAPKAAWTKPIGRVRVSPPKPRPVTSFFPPDLRPSRAKHEATRRQLAAQAGRARAQQVIGDARRDVDFALGRGPRASINSVGFAPSPPMRIGAPIPRYLKAPLRYRGEIISPAQTARDMAVLYDPNVPVARRLKAVERLHVTGLVDQYGNTTRGEKVRQDRRSLAAARRAFLKRYRELDKAAHGNTTLANLVTKNDVRGLSDEQVLDRIKDWSADDLYKTMDAHQQRMSGQLLGKSQTQLMGGNPLGLVTGVIGALETGRDVIQDVAGDNLGANLLSDALYLPMGLVGGAAMAASDPKAAWEGLKNSYLVLKAQGKDKEAAQMAQEHPLFAFLELYGAKAAAGRGAGALTRGVSGGRVGGLRRDPIALINQQGTGALFERHYSKDLFNQAAQRLYDNGVGVPGGRRVGGLKKGPTVTLRGEQVQARRLTPDRPVVGNVGKKRRSVGGEVETHLINRYMDNVASRVNSLNRLDRDTNALYARQNAPVREHRGGRVGQRLGEAVDRTLPSQPQRSVAGQKATRGERLAARFPNLYRPERDVVTHVLQGLVENMDRSSPATFRRDLAAEQQRLIRAAQKPDATPDRVDAALDQAALIQRVLENPKAWQNSKGVVRSADSLAQRLNEQEAINVKLGLDPGAAARSKLFPFAQAKMGAVYAASNAATASHAASVARVTRSIVDAKREGASPARIAGLERVLERVKSQAPKPELMRPDGRKLSNDEIYAAMREEGVSPDRVAYLSHQENALGSRAYYAPFSGASRQNLNSQQARTGSLFEQGATEYRYNHVIEQMVSHGTKAINAQQLDRMINEIAVTGPKTAANPDGYLTSKQFERVGREAKRRGQPVTAVVARQQRLSDESRAALKETQNVAEATPGMGLLEAMWDARISEAQTATAKNNLVAVPDEFLARLKAHLEVNGGGNLGGRALSSAFRKTVLPLSTKWLTGNVVEAIYRGIVIAGAVPLRDNRVAHRAWVEMLKADIRDLGWPEGVRALDKYGEAANRQQRRAALREMERFAPNARAARSELIGGMFFGNRGLTNQRGNMAPEGVGQAIANSSAGRALNKTIDGINAPSFRFNRRFEQMMQNMVLGKHLRREMQEFQGSWFKAMRAQETVLAKASKGLLDTSGMVRAGKYLDETLGRYGRFSPRVRRLVQNGLPFLPWYLNSARFTFVTLPMKHPVKLALMARVEAAFQDDWEEQHKDLSPAQRKGSLNAEYRRDDGSFTQFGRYLPTGMWGTVAAGDLGELASPVLPQFSGIIEAFRGKDPFGSPLRVPGDDGKMRELSGAEQLLYILNTGAETFTPLLGLSRRLREKGQTSLPTSTTFAPKTKPSSHPAEPGFLAALDKVFNPGRGVYLRKPSESQNQTIDELLDELESGGGEPAPETGDIEKLLEAAGL